MFSFNQVEQFATDRQRQRRAAAVAYRTARSARAVPRGGVEAGAAQCATVAPAWAS